jgi:hypothetical protein
MTFNTGTGMNPRYAFALAFAAPLALHAQTQNALDLDGVDDEVTVANASTLVANATGITLTCWVYPAHSSSWPDMDAFAGFRDNATFDFYLLQTYGTTLEGRFRNSTSGIFTIDSTALLSLNTWHFIALTYDGSQLVMYHNAVPVASAPASGSITSTTGMFRIGNMPIPGSTQIYLDGKVDETTLWKRSLTQAELQCLMNYGADPADADLQLYFKMDQGTAGGTNTGLTTLVNAAGTPNGTLTGFALNGNASNYETGCPIAGTSTATICQGETYAYNGQTLTTAGTYTTSYPVGGGCDSLATLELKVTAVNITVVQSGGNLISQALGAQYQWLDCANGYAEIPGATGPSYSQAVAGAYAVEVTQNGCTDTSACYSNVGIGGTDALPAMQVYLDAANDAVVVQGASGYAAVNVRVLDTQGRVLLARPVQQDRTLLSVAALPAGAYLVEVTAREGRRTRRVVVTH